MRSKVKVHKEIISQLSSNVSKIAAGSKVIGFTFVRGGFAFKRLAQWVWKGLNNTRYTGKINKTSKLKKKTFFVNGKREGLFLGPLM